MLDSPSFLSGGLCHEFVVPEDGGVEEGLFLTFLSSHKQKNTLTHSHTHIRPAPLGAAGSDIRSHLQQSPG